MPGKRMGRPPAEHPLNNRLHVLVNDETKVKLERCKKEMGVTTSDIVRKGIDMVHDVLDNNTH